MFWICLGITYIGGLIGIGFLRTRLSSRIHILSDRPLDLIAFFLLSVGILLTAFLHLRETGLEQAKLEYSDIAQFNWHGFTTSDSRGGGLSTIYSGWHEDKTSGHRYLKLVFPDPAQDVANFVWECNPEALAHYHDTINKHPRFPFPYVLLERCLKRRGDPSWREFALKAREILESTSRVPGPHVGIHKHFLHLVEQDLA